MLPPGKYEKSGCIELFLYSPDGSTVLYHCQIGEGPPHTVLPPGEHNGKTDSVGGGLRCPSGLLVSLVNRLVKNQKPTLRCWYLSSSFFTLPCCVILVTLYTGQLSLAIPPRIGKMSTGDDYGHRQGRNGEFCVTVGPVTRTADILTQSVI